MFTNNKQRSAMLFAVLALVAAACGGTATVDVADSAAPETAQDAAVQEDVAESSEVESTEAPTPQATSAEILIPGDFDILQPPTPIEPFEFETFGPDLGGTLCESGQQARTPFELPPPAESAVAVDPATQAQLNYSRFVLDTPDAVTAFVEKWGEGGCEATIETEVAADGSQTVTGTALIPDQPVAINLPEGYNAEAVQIDGQGIPVGILVLGGGSEVVLAVVTNPPVDEIPRILQSAASAYS